MFQYFNNIPDFRQEVPAATETLHHCTLCTNSFSTSELLKKHLRGHARFSRTCAFCGKSYRFLRDLWQHRKSHTKTCSICEKSFRNLNVLQKHMKSHTGEKPYCCTLCPKSFSESGTLKKHLNSFCCGISACLYIFSMNSRFSYLNEVIYYNCSKKSVWHIILLLFQNKSFSEII